MKVSKIFNSFFKSEKSASVILICCTVLSLALANSSLANNITAVFSYNFLHLDISHWVNELLMAFFFLLVGLELEREFYNGELSTKSKAMFPVVAAIGGMVVPALIYYLLNKNGDYAQGNGIPIATDIAFALAILSLLARKAPASLRVFLAAFAIIDDIGATIIIAFFYSNNLQWIYIAAVAAIWAALFVLNRLKIYHYLPYAIGAIALWFCMLKSGIHASISGVIIAFVLPFGDGSDTSMSNKLEVFLHKPVAFFILPLFAFVNTFIPLDVNFSSFLNQPYVLGIIAGLVIGKPVGIFLFTKLAQYFGWIEIPREIINTRLLGAACLGGIGFTMSIFITILSFTDIAVVNNAKLGIILASLLAAFLGFVVLKLSR
jgi:Na+:H+ antiporter, NhaA family